MAERDDVTLRADTEVNPAGDPVPTPADDLLPVPAPARGGCRTELRGWAGAHLHGAVRPRRKAASRGRPPGRWC